MASGSAQRFSCLPCAPLLLYYITGRKPCLALDRRSRFKAIVLAQVASPAFSFSTCCPGEPWHHRAPEGPAGRAGSLFLQTSQRSRYTSAGRVRSHRGNSETPWNRSPASSAAVARRRRGCASFQRSFGSKAKRPPAASRAERERARKRGSGWLAPSLPQQQQQQPRQRLPRGSSLAPLAPAQPL